MASVIDAFKDILSEPMAVFKVVLLSIPTYYCYQLYTVSKGASSDFFIATAITGLLLLGVIAKVTNNVINERNVVMPSFNPIPTIIASLKTIIAIGPLGFASLWLANYGCSFTTTLAEWGANTVKIILWLLATSIIVTAFLVYSAKESFLDAINLKAVFQKTGDVFIALIFFVIQLFLVNLLSVGFIGYAIYILFGFGIHFDIYVTLAVVFNIMVVGHYLGQAYYELIGYYKNKL